MRSRGHNLNLREGWTSVERYRTWVCVCVRERWREGEIYQTWVKHVHLSLMLQNFMITLTQALPHSQSQQSSPWNGRFSSFFFTSIFFPLAFNPSFFFLFFGECSFFLIFIFSSFCPPEAFPISFSPLFSPLNRHKVFLFSCFSCASLSHIAREKYVRKEPTAYKIFSVLRAKSSPCRYLC